MATLPLALLFFKGPLSYQLNCPFFLKSFSSQCYKSSYRVLPGDFPLTGPWHTNQVETSERSAWISDLFTEPLVFCPNHLHINDPQAISDLKSLRAWVGWYSGSTSEAYLNQGWFLVISHHHITFPCQIKIKLMTSWSCWTWLIASGKPADLDRIWIRLQVKAPSPETVTVKQSAKRSQVVTLPAVWMKGEEPARLACIYPWDGSGGAAAWPAWEASPSPHPKLHRRAAGPC